MSEAKERVLTMCDQLNEEEQKMMLKLAILLAQGNEEKVAAFEAIVKPVLDGVQDTRGKTKLDFFNAALDAVGA